jgi:hypothetical protein
LLKKMRSLPQLFGFLFTVSRFRLAPYLLAFASRDEESTDGTQSVGVPTLSVSISGYTVK